MPAKMTDFPGMSDAESAKLVKKANAKAKKAAKPAAAPKADKLKLPKPQRQVLDVLNRCKGALPRTEIAKRAAAAGASLTNDRISAETLTYATLAKLGYVTTDELKKGEGTDGATETVYTATAKGKAALAEWRKANKGKD